MDLPLLTDALTHFLAPALPYLLNPPRPAMIGQIALKLSELSEQEVAGILHILQALSAAEKAGQPQTAAEICETAKRRAALLADVPREQVAARLSELVEEVRREAIAKGTAIEGDWTGD